MDKLVAEFKAQITQKSRAGIYALVSTLCRELFLSNYLSSAYDRFAWPRFMQYRISCLAPKTCDDDRAPNIHWYRPSATIVVLDVSQATNSEFVYTA